MGCAISEGGRAISEGGRARDPVVAQLRARESGAVSQAQQHPITATGGIRWTADEFSGRMTMHRTSTRSLKVGELRPVIVR